MQLSYVVFHRACLFYSRNPRTSCICEHEEFQNTKLHFTGYARSALHEHILEQRQQTSVEGLLAQFLSLLTL